jgi:2-C-methyl-D-erythritol 4-phosphate cytidylyltransferase
MSSLPRGEREETLAAAPGARPAAPRRWALVPCAGVGARAGTSGAKQYEILCGRPLVAWTLEALEEVPELDAILVVLAADDVAFAEQELARPRALAAHVPRKPLHVARAGGVTRAQSVANGLDVLRSLEAREDDWVLVHDAARCLVRPESVSRLVAACGSDEVGGLLALRVPDTLKRSGSETEGWDRVSETVSRAAMWAAQTPQMFRLGMLHEALRRGLARAGTALTDEASAIEALGFRPRLVRGDYENLKVTWPEDFALAERLLRSRRAQVVPEPAAAADPSTTPRIESP